MKSAHIKKKSSEYQTFGVSYDSIDDAQFADLDILRQILPYIVLTEKEDGTFVKSLTAHFPKVETFETGKRVKLITELN